MMSNHSARLCGWDLATGTSRLIEQRTWRSNDGVRCSYLCPRLASNFSHVRKHWTRQDYWRPILELTLSCNTTRSKHIVVFLHSCRESTFSRHGIPSYRQELIHHFANKRIVTRAAGTGPRTYPLNPCPPTSDLEQTNVLVALTFRA